MDRRSVAISGSPGFSLVELSIVLVILGLLAGGVLSGQSLIRAAELRSVTTQSSQYMTAVMTFRDKYFALPGDMPNATAFWGKAGGNGGDEDCFNALSGSSKATCNGNSDSIIDWTIDSSSSHYYLERFSAWQHLANAGLVEGSYTGKSNGALGTYKQVPGSNVPSTKISNGYFDIFYYPSSSVHAFPQSTLNRNFITLYGNNSSYTILRPEEAWNLDTKLDDGNPVYGRVITHKKSSSVGTDCTSADTAPATYNVSDSTVRCILLFATGT